jgi:hypothetical protein
MRKPRELKIVAMEVLHPQATLGVLKEFSDLVRQKVSEVLAEREEFLLEPFFRSAEDAKTIRRLQSVSEREKWAVYFARYGCVVCQDSHRPYDENGMDLRCRRRTYERLRAVLRNADVKSEPPAQPFVDLDMERLAREILSALPKRLLPPRPKDPEPQGGLRVLRPEDLEFALPNSRELVERLVKRQVAEILTRRDDLAFEPFFRDRQVAYELRRLLTVPELHKWSAYFERWGCLRCGNRDRGHGSTGMCKGVCASKVRYRLKVIVKDLSAQADGRTALHAEG